MSLFIVVKLRCDATRWHTTSLQRVFLTGSDTPMRPAPSNLKTPPYVTSQPVITHRKLDFLPLNTEADAKSSTKAQPISDSTPKSKSALRFLVLATDGLWDELTSEQVVALVGGHLAGLRGVSIPKRELSELVPTTLSDSAPTVEGKGVRTSNQSNDDAVKDQGAWAFVDENVSTHLIRNAFGGADTGRLRRLLSIPAPWSRYRRDDVTVTVVWWEDGREGAQRLEETFKIERKERAKL